MTTQTAQYNTQAMDLLNEATQAAADYSSKVAARQLAFARKAAEKNGEWQKFLSAPDSAEVKQAAAEYLSFAREAINDFVQASESHFAWLERAVDSVANDAQAFLPPQTKAFGKQWVSGAKAANTAVQDCVRASYRAATDGLDALAKADDKTAAKSGKK